jgi:hypothetical protein
VRSLVQIQSSRPFFRHHDSNQEDSLFCRSGSSLLGLGCLALAAWFVVTRRDVPKTGSEALNRAIELQEAGRFDKAVQCLQTWMKGASRNTSHDGFLYQQIAMIYIAKAYKKPASRDESIRQAQLNLEKSLDFINKRDPEDNNLYLDGIAVPTKFWGTCPNQTNVSSMRRRRRRLCVSCH